MNEIYEKINEKLEAYFGKDIVIIKDCEWGDFPFVLHFTEDNPPNDVIEKAEEIVNTIMPSVFYHDEMRVVE